MRLFPAGIIPTLIMNAVNFAAVLVCVLRSLFQKKNGDTLRERCATFRFFTTDSNVLCALSSLALLPSLLSGLNASSLALPRWLILFRYVGTVSVTVTFLTVMVFLGPTQGYKKMLSGSGFWLHLICPVLSVLSFLCFEKPGALSLPESLLGMLPTVLYSFVYFYAVIIRKPSVWEDFYGFNRDGKWAASTVLMYLGTLLICLALAFL